MLDTLAEYTVHETFVTPLKHARGNLQRSILLA